MTKRRLISSGFPLERTMGYSRAVAVGDWCFVSGTTGYDPSISGWADDPLEQARQCFRIIRAALDEAGFRMEDIVRVQYTVTDASVVDVITPALGEAFGEIRPAATMVISSLIRPEMKVEIEVTAFRG